MLAWLNSWPTVLRTVEFYLQFQISGLNGKNGHYHYHNCELWYWDFSVHFHMNTEWLRKQDELRKSVQFFNIGLGFDPWIGNILNSFMHIAAVCSTKFDLRLPLDHLITDHVGDIALEEITHESLKEELSAPSYGFKVIRQRKQQVWFYLLFSYTPICTTWSVFKLSVLTEDKAKQIVQVLWE